MDKPSSILSTLSVKNRSTAAFSFASFKNSSEGFSKSAKDSSSVMRCVDFL